MIPTAAAISNRFIHVPWDFDADEWMLGVLDDFESQEVYPLDKMGRVLVPPTLRAHASLEKDVVWVGMVKVMELWSRAGWAKAQEDARAAADSADVARVLAELRQ